MLIERTKSTITTPGNTGNHQAVIRITGEKGTREKTINKDIYINIDNGQGNIQVDKENYVTNLVNGEILE